METVRQVLADAWDSLRRPMTAGQKQSSALLVPLTVALLFYGRPAEPAAAPEPAPPPAAAPANDLVDLTSPAPSTPPATAAPRPAATTPPAPSRPPATSPPAAPPPTTTVAPRPSAAPARIVAITRGEDDETMARAFLADRALDATVIALDPEADVCADALAAGQLVVASLGLGPSLRACLVEGGATVIAYDALGDLPPASAGAGQVLSTRRGFAASLVELAVWAASADALAEPAGLVTTESARPEVEQAIASLASAGIEFDAVSYVADDNPDVDIAAGALEFFQAGIATTVFAAPTAIQQAWVERAGVLSPDMAYLVADVFDALLDPSYADAFDGATALATVQFPWSSDGAAERAACDAVWDASGGGDLGVEPRLRMYAWCQHATLAARAGAGDLAGLRSTALRSPLTTRLAPLSAGGWGPATNVVARWGATCGCWAGASTIDRTTEARS